MADLNLDFGIELLGQARIASPMTAARYVGNDERVLYSTDAREVKAQIAERGDALQMERAGPREKIYFDPSKLKCGIVTCGGLCPGLNDVIRAVVMSCFYHYGVRTVYGFQYGYEGLSSKYTHAALELTPDSVSRIHEMGGSILASSRGNQDPVDMVDTLERLNVGLLFTVGGDGTLRGALALAAEIKKRGLKIGIIGIPKTIDNDIQFVSQSFGFATACSEARNIVAAANVEAMGARNGVGLVKLMGRDSGFIAAYTTLANNDVNICLVPEVPFSIEGLLRAISERLERRGHAVIVVAEGAGQEFFQQEKQKDASGNVMYGDIGRYLRDQMRSHFKAKGIELNLKYIDPSYTIRSTPANAQDSAYCLVLGHNAVHAGMSGRTAMMVANWKGDFTHVPIAAAVSCRKKIDARDWLWRSVLSTTGQPASMVS